MREHLFTYLEQPSLETFMALRQAALSSEGFDPYSSELDGISALMEAGSWEQVIETISKSLFPNHLLSPGAHMSLGFAYHKLGREKESRFEQVVYTALLDGIKSTGAGTEEQPYHVTRTSDEYDLLMVEELRPTQQALIKKDGRAYDVMTTESGQKVWFDITEIMTLLDRRLGIQPE
ncbi:DUF4919 domain-containing protein [Prosthecobacter sp.]|uniref:DUF4919 domain-containing protein n=1 Tax=Prosthecobacter sp. TaxID=1965333 RepID=UPI0037830078